MEKDTTVLLDQVKYSKFFIVQVKNGYEWQNKNVFRRYNEAKSYSFFLEDRNVRIDCFTLSCGIHTYVMIK